MGRGRGPGVGEEEEDAREEGGEAEARTVKGAKLSVLRKAQQARDPVAADGSTR